MESIDSILDYWFGASSDDTDVIDTDTEPDAPSLSVAVSVTRYSPSVPGVKVPHVGWSPLSLAAPWAGTALAGLDGKPFMYFVHSYAVAPARAQDRLALTPFADGYFCSVLRAGNVTGCQFHPEKSAEQGLKILSNFVNNLQESIR